MPGHVGLQDRRILVPDEIMLRLSGGLPRQHADIAARQQGLETGNVAGKEPRLDHPEDRLVRQQRLGLVGRGDRDDDMRVVGGELEAFDGAKDDVLELELRLAGL